MLWASRGAQGLAGAGGPARASDLTGLTLPLLSRGLWHPESPWVGGLWVPVPPCQVVCTGSCADQSLVGSPLGAAGGGAGLWPVDTWGHLWEAGRALCWGQSCPGQSDPLGSQGSGQAGSWACSCQSRLGLGPRLPPHACCSGPWGGDMAPGEPLWPCAGPRAWWPWARAPGTVLGALRSLAGPRELTT